jgi:hypothetical protein
MLVRKRKKERKKPKGKESKKERREDQSVVAESNECDSPKKRMQMKA